MDKYYIQERNEGRSRKWNTDQEDEQRRMEEDLHAVPEDLPPGCERIQGTPFWRNPENDWMYSLGWVPPDD
eukprot:13610004-Heterocapsa_arctica.AAC.1